ncbi:TIR domain-containing protein [Alkalihalobacillus hwajinpoensis]|uniref:TIR domain-containing protein n=1 Tax=Guptibacillus hwajinpoensis TaxID=208199 RepID=UPI001883BB73|nr:TIR domain-containing protein [Pseudalkalibacillus hwajinpoensis]MBF0706025.1 TIR domain-containing protein [Pseudalkalibacillus hwajinpoensis]
MTNKNVFVSFHYGLDKHYKNLLNAWDANTAFNFKFTDRSVKVPINSNNASVIRAGITKKMKTARYCLVIVGQETHKSQWVDWEIRKAKELGLKLIGVKISNSNPSPSALLGSNATWARSFSQEGIIKALNQML